MQQWPLCKKKTEIKNGWVIAVPSFLWLMFLCLSVFIELIKNIYLFTKFVGNNMNRNWKKAIVTPLELVGFCTRDAICEFSWMGEICYPIFMCWRIEEGRSKLFFYVLFFFLSLSPSLSLSFAHTQDTLRFWFFVHTQVTKTKFLLFCWPHFIKRYRMAMVFSLSILYRSCVGFCDWACLWYLLICNAQSNCFWADAIWPRRKVTIRWEQKTITRHIHTYKHP